MLSLLDNCGDGCGWVAALVAAVAYGSFGVPIRATKYLDIHPLVFQSYKTVTLFLLCWLVVLIVNGSIKITFKWGFISGMLWVLGGTGGVYAIRLAGLAVAVGTWASVMIIVNFIWGILIFKEPVESILGTIGAFSLLGIGLVGMSVYSAPNKQSTILPEVSTEPELPPQSTNIYHVKETTPPGSPTANDHLLPTSNVDDESYLESNFALYAGDNDQSCHQVDDLYVDESSMMHPTTPIETISFTVFKKDIVITKRSAGIIGAVINGIMTGSSLVPMHYAKHDGYGGAMYTISLGVGSLLANTLLWILYYLFFIVQLYVAKTALPTRTLFSQAYFFLPSTHFAELWRPGLLAGVLLTIAMFGSILAVTYLGQGIGNSVVQAKILVSGIWGILFFREIQGCTTVSLWLASATCTIVGIIWLCEERLMAVNHYHKNHL